ncbi:FISUMP domain-containing protein [Sphingobacteruim zhuxiongii]|uniref:FISUMP domain-containing protein n=1 Tax=Sphingobacterium zhuxiongii TaxID=2662364 RepID=UPI00136647A5|nr:MULTISPECIES: FISUMP domain-containing protein [unclassified Sphingobacterium]
MLTIYTYGVTLTSLTFPTDRGSNRTFTSNLNFNFTKSFTPQLGKRYKIIIDFLTTFRNVNNLGRVVDWAYHNLFYNDATKVYGFRHYNSNVYEKGVSAGATNSGEYFNWKAAKPGNAQATGVVDPCTLVYPAGRWRMPTTAEFNTIVNIPNGTTAAIRKSNARSSDPVRYIDIRLGTGTFPPYDDYTNGLPMLMLGYRNVGSESLTNYNTGTTGDAVLYYWTSNETSSTTANYFRVQNSSDSGSLMTILNPATNLKTYGFNIRCVRNRSYVYQPNIN